MCKEKRNITINIGPQNSESWLYVMGGLAIISFFAFAVPKLAEMRIKEQVIKAQVQAKIVLAFFINPATVLSMNSTILFSSKGLFLLAVNALALDATPAYEVNVEDMTISVDRDEAIDLVAVLHDNGIFHFTCSDGEFEDERLYPGEDMDGDAASALASAGMGTDEDYGHHLCDEEPFSCLGDES